MDQDKQNAGVSEFGLPLEIKYCTKCVESNQRMISSSPFRDQKTGLKETTIFDEEGVCSACRYYEKKRTIDWQQREKELMDILARFRRNDGYYDVLVPGSGGKDSVYTSHVLKHKYGMHPLTVTWAPHMYTEVGWRNFQSWIHAGFDNILFTPNGRVHRTLTRLAFENLLHPFQPFVFGQNNIAPKIAIEKGIKLIFTGDYAPEKGFSTGKHSMDFSSGKKDFRAFSVKGKKEDIYIGGVHVSELGRYGINREDLNPYLPADYNQLMEHKMEFHFFPYYVNYDPQRSFYYAAEHSGFEVNPDGRTEGTYTKYQSLDDKVDGFHYFTWFIKTGRGRATEDAALDIRNGHITREEGVALVRQFDGEFPKKYFKDFLQYVELTEERFWEIINKFRAPHVWEKRDGQWKIRKQVT